MAAQLRSCLQHPDARLAPVAPSLDRGTVGSPCPFPRAFRDWGGSAAVARGVTRAGPRLRSRPRVFVRSRTRASACRLATRGCSLTVRTRASSRACAAGRVGAWSGSRCSRSRSRSLGRLADRDGRRPRRPSHRGRCQRRQAAARPEPALRSPARVRQRGLFARCRGPRPASRPTAVPSTHCWWRECGHAAACRRP